MNFIDMMLDSDHRRHNGQLLSWQHQIAGARSLERAMSIAWRRPRPGKHIAAEAV